MGVEGKVSCCHMNKGMKIVFKFRGGAGAEFICSVGDIHEGEGRSSAVTKDVFVSKRQRPVLGHQNS